MSSSIAEKLPTKNSAPVSPFLHFYDEKLSQEYEKFKVAQSNTYAFIPLHFCCCLYFFFGAINGMLLSFDWFNILNFTAILFFQGVVGTWLMMVHFKERFFTDPDTLKALDATYITRLESNWLMGCAASLSLVVFALARNGACPMGGNFQLAQGCNYSGSANELPMDLVMTLFFGPIIHAAILKGASFLSVIAALSINASSLFVVMYMYTMSFGGPLILLFCPMCVLVLYEFQRQGIVVFLMSQSQAMLLEEIDRLSAQTSKELRSMIGNVAHDLKTPMSAFVSGLDFVSSILDEIQQKLSDSNEVVKGIRAINESVINMKNINHFMRMSINRCIDYTKASNGMVLVPHMETVNFREMLQLPLNCMKNLQDGKVAIELIPVGPEIATNIITDPQWFQENVLCLLSNAVKYSAEGTVTIAVSMVPASTNTSTSGSFDTQDPPERIESRICIDIIDTGIGIADDVKSRLFTPFKQAQRLAGGTGLGLYSLAKRMEALGGKYGVRNRPDGQQGSNFWFSFPYRPDENTERIIAANEEKLETIPEEKRSLNILLVDDSISILKMSGKMLTRLGHNVTTAENGAIALKMMSRTFLASDSGSTKHPGGDFAQKYDVVLMDLQMPIMDGLEATKRLRALEGEHGDVHHQMICGLSANSDLETTQAAFEAGVDDFIPKPFNAKNFDDMYFKLSQKFKHNSGPPAS